MTQHELCLAGSGSHRRQKHAIQLGSLWATHAAVYCGFRWLIHRNNAWQRTPPPPLPLPLSILSVACTLAWVQHVVQRYLGLHYLPPRHSLSSAIASQHVVVLRWVTRGSFPALTALVTAQASRALSRLRLPPAAVRLQLVVDGEAALPASLPAEVEVIRVPPSYATPRGTRYKARCLHYAATQHRHRPALPLGRCHVVHLDEDSRVGRAAIEESLRFCAAHPRAMGGGLVCYDNGSDASAAAACVQLLDCQRIHTLDSLVKSAVLTSGTAALGCQGSFWAVPQADLVAGCFDIGPKGCCSEDLWMSQSAAEFGWIHGPVFEQTATSFSDFLRQRARYLSGQVLVALHHPLPVRCRLNAFVQFAYQMLMPVSFPLTFVGLLNCRRFGFSELDLFLTAFGSAALVFSYSWYYLHTRHRSRALLLVIPFIFPLLFAIEGVVAFISMIMVLVEPQRWDEIKKRD